MELVTAAMLAAAAEVLLAAVLIVVAAVPVPSGRLPWLFCLEMRLPGPTEPASCLVSRWLSRLADAEGRGIYQHTRNAVPTQTSQPSGRYLGTQAHMHTGTRTHVGHLCCGDLPGTAQQLFREERGGHQRSPGRSYPTQRPSVLSNAVCWESAVSRWWSGDM